MTEKVADILIVEDDDALREALTDTLELAGYRIATAVNGVDALSELENGAARLILSDVQMGQMDGMALLEQAQRRWPEIPVVLMTAYGTIEKAVLAMRLGAADYLVKPFEAGALLERVARHIAEARVNSVEAGPVASETMHNLLALAAKVAKSDATVLILGESGSGKEVLARYLHRHSARAAGPLVAINCAAIPENMLEAMLFGYEKGAFTGAVQSTPGKFEQAQGGILLLDEVSEMALALQAKLLRVLQEKEVERLGGRKAIALDVRVLATSNRDLKACVARGAFREDLYYRLNVFPLTVPPLRERGADILPLALALLERHWRGGKPLPPLQPEAERRLLQHRWPGNVRELENVMQRALILHEGQEIDPAAILFDSDDGEAPGGEGAAREEESALESGLRGLEEKIILDALHAEGGNRKASAARLGVSERTLRYKLARMREAGVVLPD
ncbi:MAG TPA: sigma-54 dependent transcriptional regulator [Methylococcaceae bacterium]|nr:sigma-54 dependent transcriptional regulator [Methylococcaceae bacterium]